MLHKLTWVLGVAGMISVVFITGCGSSVTFQPDEIKAYKVVGEKGTGINEIAYVQKIDSVNPDGTAKGTVTMKDLEYSLKDKGGQITSAPLKELAGTSFPVEIKANGDVKILGDTGLEKLNNPEVKKYVNTASLEKQLSDTYKKPSATRELQYTHLKLDYQQGQTGTYQSSTDVIKDYRFEQPNLGKLKAEQTKTHIDMTYTQTIQSVNADGSATAKITIDGLKVDIVNKNQPVYNYDSEKDKKTPLSKLLGKSYTITVTPAGTVSHSDTKNVMNAVTSGYEEKIVKSLFDPKSIQTRHEISALPASSGIPYITGDSWNTVVPSPPGLLTPKNYEKTYTLASIKDTIATVTMTAAESAQAAEAEGQSTGPGMGIFAKMFDNTDDYTGSMKLDTASGEVLEYNDTLISSYIAQEQAKGGDPAKGPDTLTMKFTNRIQLTKVK